MNQNDIGRMLAYSSIAQAGYILIAVPALTEGAVSGAIAHTMVHAFMKGGAFIIVAGVGAVFITIQLFFLLRSKIVFYWFKIFCNYHVWSC